MVMHNSSQEWGTPGWFRRLLKAQGTDEPGAYFAYRKNGFQKARHRSLLTKFNRLPSSETGHAILDVGCATGDLIASIVENRPFSKVAGVDFVDDLVAVAQQRYPSFAFQQAGLPELPFADSTFNTVVLSEVFYYVPEELRRASVAEISRVLSDGGVLFVASALGENYLDEERLRTYFTTHFNVEQVWYDYFRGYHRLIKPVIAAYRVCVLVLTGTESESGRIASAIRRYEPLTRNPLARGVAHFGRWACNRIQGWTGLARATEALSRVLAPSTTRSHVIMVLRKR